jgi:hypothetical protein
MFKEQVATEYPANGSSSLALTARPAEAGHYVRREFHNARVALRYLRKVVKTFR